MAGYRKSRPVDWRKTPPPSTRRRDFSQLDVKEMEKLLETVLKNNTSVFKEQKRFITNHFSKFYEYLEAKEEEKAKLSDEIHEHAKEGLQLGLTIEQVYALNLIFAERRQPFWKKLSKMIEKKEQ